MATALKFNVPCEECFRIDYDPEVDKELKFCGVCKRLLGIANYNPHWCPARRDESLRSEIKDVLVGELMRHYRLQGCCAA